MKTTTFSTTIQLLILLTLTSIPIPTSFAASSHHGATPPPTKHSPPPPLKSSRSTHAATSSAATSYSGDTRPPAPSPSSRSTRSTTYSGAAATPAPLPSSRTSPATTYCGADSTPPPIPYGATPYSGAYPPPIPFAAAQPPQLPMHNNPSIFSTVLNQLGFPALAGATSQANLSTGIPTTIFAPSDSSLLTCPTCSLPLLLQEHSLPGLYSLHYLRSLAFGTKIETLAPNRCLTITSTPSAANPAAKKVFINGVEITKPDMFNDGFLIIHGLEGFVSHLSPDSCLIERQTTLVYPSQPLPTAEYQISRMLLRDAMMRLRVSGYSVVALAMRVKYWELCEMKGLTMFALDDDSIFAGGIGHAYVADIGYHIVPNRVLMGADLEGMSSLTVLPTMERWQSLVVTTANGGGPMMPMRINYVKIKTLDLVHNNRIVVHGLSMPFPHVDDPQKYE